MPFGPGDDGALMSAHARRVITTDALVEGTHFLRAHPPRALGWKAAAVNLSDVAAMGAIPEAFLLTAAIPPDLPLSYWRGLASGLGLFAERHGVHLAGGDTVRASGPLMVALTAWGRLPEGCAPLARAGGRPGDLVMVAGPIGRAGHGGAIWLARHRDGGAGARWASPDSGPPEAVLEAHLSPHPPLWAGPWAAAHDAHAGMDLSDGLATDLPRLAAASQVDIVVDLDTLPVDDLLRGVDPRTRAADGEDYGLVVLVPPRQRETFETQGFVAIGYAQAPARPGQTGLTWQLGGQPVDPVAPRFRHFGS
jgi:thiamine-monophosphate kinase